MNSNDDDDFPLKTPVTRFSKAIIGGPPAPFFPRRVAFKLRSTYRRKAPRETTGSALLDRWISRIRRVLPIVLIFLFLTPLLLLVVPIVGLFLFDTLGPVTATGVLVVIAAWVSYRVLRRRLRDPQRDAGKGEWQR